MYYGFNSILLIAEGWNENNSKVAYWTDTISIECSWCIGYCLLKASICLNRNATLLKYGESNIFKLYFPIRLSRFQRGYGWSKRQSNETVVLVGQKLMCHVCVFLMKSERLIFLCAYVSINEEGKWAFCGNNIKFND